MAHRQLSLQGVQRSVMQLDAYSRHKKFVNGASCFPTAATTVGSWRQRC
jgi:hypothetical protein